MRAGLGALIVFFSALAYAQALYNENGPVKILDPKSFRKEVTRGEGIWFVEFYAPWCGHCRNLAPEWKKAAKALKGIVNVAAVDADEHKQLGGQYGVQGFPTIKIFAGDKSKPVDYNGERTAKAIADAGLSEARKLVRQRMDGGSNKKSKSKSKSKTSGSSNKKKGSDVVTLTDDNFDDLVLNSNHVWLVEFYAPWCGHCKALAPEWEQAASNLKGSVKLGALDATSEKAKASEYGIQGFPTIKVFRPSASSPRDAMDYQGERTSAAITNYAFEVLEKYGGVSSMPELSSQAVLEEHCGGKSICVVAFLPHILDSMKKGREKYLDILKEARKSVRSLPLRFAWVQGGDQESWESTFGLTFGFPSLVALNLQKNRFAVQRGSFTAKSISSFLQGLASGRESTIPYNKLPNLKTVVEWDGEEAKPPQDFDDEDDDIMKEILANKDEL